MVFKDRSEGKLRGAKAGTGMNYIWAGMILIGMVYGILTGHIDAVSDAVLDSSKEAVTLCITMLGVMGLWMGLMEIAKDAGLVRSISRRKDIRRTSTSR